MKILIKMLSTCVIFFYISIVSAEPISIMGLSLNGTFPLNIRICTLKQIGDSKTTCFIDKPYKWNDGLSYSLQIPETSKPEWAAYTSLKIYINKRNILSSIEIALDNESEFFESIKSITTRFSKPTFMNIKNDGVSEAVWNLPNIYIRIHKFFNKDISIVFWTKEYYKIDKKFREKSVIKRPHSF